MTLAVFHLKFNSPIMEKVNLVEMQLPDDYICTIEHHPQYFYAQLAFI